MSSSDRTRSRLAQYSLRALLLLMLTSGVGLGWLAICMRRGRHEELIVGRLRDAGVSVSFDQKFQSPTASPAAKTSWFVWSRRILGEHFFIKVTGLHAQRQIAADRLNDIQHLRDLRKVYLNDTAVTDRTLEYIARSPELNTLYLGGSDITDAGISHLRTCNQLSTIVLWETDVSDASVKLFTNLPQLANLYLQCTEISDAGVRQLAESDLHVTLRELDLSSTKVTDASIEHLSKFAGLERLSMRELPITDAQLQLLRGLQQLQLLDLTGTLVSKHGVKQLDESLQNCRIFWQNHP